MKDWGEVTLFGWEISAQTCADHVAINCDTGGAFGAACLTPDQARRFAAWLVAAADELEGKA